MGGITCITPATACQGSSPIARMNMASASVIGDFGKVKLKTYTNVKNGPSHIMIEAIPATTDNQCNTKVAQVLDFLWRCGIWLL